MDFVVLILTTVFHKSAVAGIYTFDIAMTKVLKATGMASEAGFPLRLSMEPVDDRFFD